MSNDNIKVFTGGQKPNINAQELRQWKADLPLLLEAVEIAAKLMRAKYDALKKEGFNDAQALELCK